MNINRAASTIDHLNTRNSSTYTIDESPSSTTASGIAFPRLRRWYTGLALFVLNAVVFLAVLTTALHLACTDQQFFWSSHLGGLKQSDYFVPEHYYLLQQGEVRQIRKDYDQLVLAGTWKINPHGELTNRPFDGNQVNVNQHGQRATVPPSSAHSEYPPLRIWAFGGSTQFGWGMPDRLTLSSLLQTELQSRIADRQIQIVNFGVPWYNSLLETRALTTLLSDVEIELPHFIFFLDGLNDLYEAVYYQGSSPLSSFLGASWERGIGHFLSPPPWITLTPNFPALKLLTILNPQGALINRDNQLPEDFQALTLMASRKYIRNTRASRELAAIHHIPSAFLLQPVPRWTSEDREQVDNKAYALFVSETLRSKGNLPIHDLSGALSRLTRTQSLSVEANGVHYSDAATQLLAQRIAELFQSFLSPELSAKNTNMQLG